MDSIKLTTKQLNKLKENVQVILHDRLATVLKNPEITLSKNFSKELKVKYYQRNFSISELATLSEDQLKELKGKKKFSEIVKYNYGYSGLSVDKAIELARYSMEEYQRVLEYIDAIGLIHKYIPKKINEKKINEKKKKTNITELKEVLRVEFRHQIAIVKLKAFMYGGDFRFPENILQENADLFLINSNLPDEVKERYFTNNLKVRDLIAYPEAFQNIPIDYRTSDLDYLIEFIRDNYGVGNFQKLLFQHQDVFVHIADNYESLELLKKLEQGRNLDLESNFTQAVKEYYIEKIDRGLKNTISDIPGWLSSMNFKWLKKINTKTDLLEYDNSVIVMDGNQRNFLENVNLNMENIKRMEREMNFFLHGKSFDENKILNNISDYYAKNNHSFTDLENRALSYEEFLDQIADILDIMRINNCFRNKENYDWIQGDFRKKHPEIFMDFSAPENLKRSFYWHNLSLVGLYEHLEYYPYLLNKNLAKEIDYYPPRLRLSNIVDSQGHELSNTSNFIQEYTSRYGNEKFLQLVSKYGSLLSGLEISNMNGEIENEQKIEKAIRDAVYDRITRYGINYSRLENNPEFVSEHPEIFIDVNAPEMLKQNFYDKNLTLKSLYEHPEYYSYLLNKKFALALSIWSPKISLKVAPYEYTDFIDEYTSRYGNEKFFQLVSKYGIFLDSFEISNMNGEIENEQKIEKAIRDAIYDNITKENIDYSDLENNPEFVSEYPEIFLKENVPLEIKKKFYSRRLSMADFIQNPNLVDILNNTNIAFGFSVEYMFTSELFNKEDPKIANLKRLKVISEMAQIEDYQQKEKVKKYVEEHKDNLNMETLSSLKTVLKRVEYSNSSELRSFKDNFFENLLNLDDPIAGLEKIEKVFIQNNLPFFAKMFLSFQHIYPDFTKGNEFNFSDNSRIAPQLKDQSLPNIGYHLTPLEKRFRIIYNDLLRITYRSGSLDLMEYLNQLEIGNDLFINYINNGYKQNNFSKEDKQTFDVFMSHLETMYENLSKEDIHNLPLEEKSKILYKTFEPNTRYDFKDRVVRTFCYSAGITTFNQLKELVISSKKEADERGRKYAEELSNKPFEFEEGDFLRGMGDFESLSGSLAIGNVCKEQLISIKQTSDTDTTPLDIDITLVNNKPSDIYHAVNDTPTGFGFGNVFQIIKKDNPNFVITRDKDGNLTNESYNPLKAELFGTHIKETGEGYETHWGARTGVAMTDIDYLLYKQDRIIDGDKPYDKSGNVNYKEPDTNTETNSPKDDGLDLDIIKYEIAKNGFYLPVIDFSGKLIYSVEEYENIRNMMQGLSHYGVSEYKLSEHLNLPECPISSELTLPSSEWISSQLKETNQETVIKREKIKQVLKPVFDEFNLSIKEEIDGDLTPGSVEFIDTGSTGRGTNKPHDGDFDFLLRLDNDLLLDSNRKNKFMERLREVIETYPHSNESFTTDNGDFRYKKVKLDEETTIDLDLSFVGKTNKVMYSSDMCVKDRLATIKKQYPEQYDLVVANIIQAKMFLKSQGVYKPFRSDKTQGGLGGIGVENWILQHGGSFLDAATSFVQASEGKEFQEFKKDYQIWDFGANHFADRKNIDFNPTLYQRIDAYPYDNFVAKNMSEAGYNKMRQALKQYLTNYNHTYQEQQESIDEIRTR